MTSDEIPESVREQVMTELRQVFRPEFLNRLDDTVLFKPLSLSEITTIVNLLIVDTCRRLEDKRITIVLSDEAQKWVGEKGYNPVYGARPLKRFLQKQLENRLARAIISGEIAEGANVRFEVENDQLVMHIEESTEVAVEKEG